MWLTDPSRDDAAEELDPRSQDAVVGKLGAVETVAVEEATHADMGGSVFLLVLMVDIVFVAPSASSDS